MAAHASPPIADTRSVATVSSVGVIGKYRVLRELGRGSMGAVYEAEHRQLGKRVAIKVLHPHLRSQPVATERFLREARFAARLEHPSIVGVSDVDLEAEVGPHLVMELVDGPSLAGLLLAEHALEVPRAIDLVLPVVSAIAHAHAAGIVHRDLKPANIIVGARAGELAAKVTDFGVGKVLDEAGATPRTDSTGEGPLTLDGGLVGSLPYMAPEQVRDARAVDARADQYALAAILYELTTGRPAFAHTLTFDLMRAIDAGDHMPAHEAHGQIAPAFSAVLRRAMSVRPDDRYPSMGAFGRALLPFASPRGWVRWSRDLGPEEGGPAAQTRDEQAPSDLGTWASSAATAKSEPPARARKTAGAFVATALAAVVVGVVVGRISRVDSRQPGSDPPSTLPPAAGQAVGPAAPGAHAAPAANTDAPPPAAVSAAPLSAPTPTVRAAPATLAGAPAASATSRFRTGNAPIGPSPAPSAAPSPAPSAAPSASNAAPRDQYGQNRAPILE